jgi:hypothetical protein
MKEIWKDISGYEGIYQVSNKGNVRSYKAFKNGENLKPRKRRGGYFGVGLSKNGKVNYQLVHRLVAIAFIENPQNKPYVNHIDENPSNNNVENLEWVTNNENMLHSNCYVRHRKIKPHQEAEIIEQYLLGKSIFRLVKETGYKQLAITNVLKRNNIRIRDRHERSKS